MNKTRTALFGGSFDPVHLGHVSLGRAVLENGLADEVWFLVTPQNPHKQAMSLTDENERLRMVELALAGGPGYRQAISNLLCRAHHIR